MTALKRTFYRLMQQHNTRRQQRNFRTYLYRYSKNMMEDNDNELPLFGHYANHLISYYWTNHLVIWTSKIRKSPYN